MARIKLLPELKKEISTLTSKEKDKLLFRMLPSHDILVESLEYSLLEKEQTLEERKQDIKSAIDKVASKYPHRYYSPNYLLVEIRSLSGRINRHLKVTKDKVGEIELQFYLVNTLLSTNLDELKKEGRYMMEKLDRYIVARGKKINGLLRKVHEDLILEFENDMIQFGNIVGELESMRAEAAESGFSDSSFREGMIY